MTIRLRNERGATAVEYAMLVGFLSLAGYLAVPSLFNTVGGEIKSLVTSSTQESVAIGPGVPPPISPDPTGGPSGPPLVPTPVPNPGPPPVLDLTPHEPPPGLTPTFKIGTWSTLRKHTPTFPLSLVPGSYDLTFLTWDSYLNRPDQPFERAEIWLVFADGTEEMVTVTTEVPGGDYAESLDTVRLSTDKVVVGIFGKVTQEAIDSGSPNSVNVELVAVQVSSPNT